MLAVFDWKKKEGHLEPFPVCGDLSYLHNFEMNLFGEGECIVFTNRENASYL